MNFHLVEGKYDVITTEELSKFEKDYMLAHVIYLYLLSFLRFILFWQENFLLFTQSHLEK